MFAVVVVLLLWPSLLWAQPWTPPQGIPMPSFGVSEVAGSVSLTVDAAHPMPTVVAPCSVIQIVGVYAVDHTGPNRIHAAGTPSCPVFIRGGEQTATWEISGTYWIREQATISGYLVVVAAPDYQPTHHFAIRDNAFTTAGMTLQTYDENLSSGSSVNHGVIIRNTFHDIGDMNTTTDQDTLGLSLYRGRIHHIWFGDNSCVRVSSDCVQVNAHDEGAETVHHIYLFRTHCDTNRQGCLWLKQSADVVMVENDCTNMRPNSGGAGQCYGGQYDARRVWVVRNVARNSENGIVTSSYVPDTAPGGWVVVGNLFVNIRATAPPTAIDNVWANGAALRFIGGGAVAAWHNTFVNVDGALQIGRFATVSALNNVHAQVYRGMLAYDTPPAVFATMLFDAPSAIYDGPSGVTGTPSVAALVAGSHYVGDPQFVNAMGGDYRLAATSPGHGLAQPLPADINAIYYAQHGVSFGLDLADIGANMTTTPSPEPPPPPPPVCNWFWRLFNIRTPANCQPWP